MIEMCFASLCGCSIIGGILNSCIFVSGWLLIGIGTHAVIELKDYQEFLGSQYLSASIAFIIIGSMILIGAFFQWCEALVGRDTGLDNVESGSSWLKKRIRTFATFMALILMVEIGLIITIYIFKGDVLMIISNNMRNGIVNYNINATEDFRGVNETWDIIQLDLKCCGIESFHDWNGTSFGDLGNIPASCCKIFTNNCGQGVLKLPDEKVAEVIYTEGCFDKFKNVVLSNVGLVAGISLGVAVFHGFGVLITLLAPSMIRKFYKVVCPLIG